jgi:hypothetical protein
MARTHYHAGWNTAGYLPEADVYSFSSRRAAVSYVYQAAREHLEGNRDIERDMPRGDRRRWTLTGRDGDYWLDNDSPTHLPTHYWVSDRCTCDDDADDDD